MQRKVCDRGWKDLYRHMMHAAPLVYVPHSHRKSNFWYIIIHDGYRVQIFIAHGVSGAACQGQDDRLVVFVDAVIGNHYRDLYRGCTGGYRSRLCDTIVRIWHCAAP